MCGSSALHCEKGLITLGLITLGAHPMISLVLSKDYDPPLQTLSNTVLMDARCKLQAIFIYHPGW